MVWTQLCDVSTIIRTISKWDMRVTRRRLRYHLDIWMKLIVDRGKLKDLEKWGLRSWMQSSMTQLGAIVKAWQECVAKAKHFEAIRKRFFDQGLSGSFYRWNDYMLQSRKERHVLRRCLHRIGFRELNIVFQQWHECVGNTKRFSALTKRYWVHSLHSAFHVWRDATIESRKIRKIIVRGSFTSWREFTITMKMGRVLMNKTEKRSDTSILKRFMRIWGENVVTIRTSQILMNKHEKRSRKIIVRGSFTSWRESTITMKMVRVLMHKTDKRSDTSILKRYMRIWGENVVTIRMGRILMNKHVKRSDTSILKRYMRIWGEKKVTIRMGRILMHKTEKRSDTSILKWFTHIWGENVRYTRERVQIRGKRVQLRCQQHMLASWRRILVVERIFRRRTYNILPAAVFRHDWLLVRHVTRAWRKWARHTRSISFKLQRSQLVCCRRLLRGVYVAVTHIVQAAQARMHLADLQARRGLRLLAARSLYNWLMEVKTSREEALVQDRAVKVVQQHKSFNFMATCGNVVRSWATWTVCRQMYRKKVQMIRNMERRNHLRTSFQKYVNTFKTQKRHRHVVLRRHQLHCQSHMKVSFACIVRYTASGRIVRSFKARKLRLYKSKLLHIWQQTAGMVNLRVNFDKQRFRTYNFCMHQRCKRSAMRFMHQWIIFLDHRRSWNKFIQRIARKRMSQMLHSWRSAMFHNRVFERRVQASERRWLSNRIHQWKRNTERTKEQNDGKVQYINEIHVRSVLREWAKRATKKRHKWKLIARIIKRRERVMLEQSWNAFSGVQSRNQAIPLIVKCMTQLLRTTLMSWRQAALMVPSTSVSVAMNRMPHRALLSYILKQLRKYTRKLKAAMFKIHPQFRLMKVWNLWQNLRRRLLSAHVISDAISKTVQAHYLSSVMRQWLYAVTVPASEAEEVIVNKMNRRLVLKYFGFLVEFAKYIKEILAMAIEHRKGTFTRMSFALFRQIITYCRDLRVKSAKANRNYELFLMADYFYDIRDTVLEDLRFDESVMEIVRAKTRGVYLYAGMSAFFMLWDEARTFRGRCDFFRRNLDLGLMKEAFDGLIEDLKSSKTANELINKKYKDRNENAMKNRVFGNWCCAMDNQQRQYLEIEETIRIKNQHLSLRYALDAFAEEVQIERERASIARKQLNLRLKGRANNLIVCQLKLWVEYSRKLEQKVLHKHRVYLMNLGFIQMMMAMQNTVDPGLMKQYLRARRHKKLYRTFRGLVSIMKRRQRLYEAHIEVRQNRRSRLVKLHWRVWCEAFALRRKRNARLSQLVRNHRRSLSQRSLLAWSAVWLQQVYIGNKLVLLRKRFFLLHIKAPAMERWKRFKHNVARLLVAYCRIVRTRTLGYATRLLWCWKHFVVESSRTLRKIQGILIHKRCSVCRKAIQAWQRSIYRRCRAGDLSLSHLHACRRKHLQEWRSYCVEQLTVQERARTYHVIIKTSKARRRRDVMSNVFTGFAENLFGARSVACSLYRRVKWQYIRAKHGSLLQRAFVTWRRHWIEVEQLGEALRRILSQRRTKVDLHHPFWAWVRYMEDRLNIKRETALVHKTGKILKEILDVYGEPMASDFSIRAERAYTIDDLIKLLRKYQQHHSDLLDAAKLQGAAPPRVVSYGPVPYSHYIMNLGKQRKEDSHHSFGLSPPGVTLGAAPVNLSRTDSTGQLGVNLSQEFPPGIIVPDRFLRSSPDIQRVSLKYPSAKPSVQRKLENGLGT